MSLRRGPAQNGGPIVNRDLPRDHVIEAEVASDDRRG